MMDSRVSFVWGAEVQGKKKNKNIQPLGAGGLVWNSVTGENRNQ